MEYVLIWVIISLFIGAVGGSKRIGFVGAFFISLLLSPVIGLIVVIFSKSKEDKHREDEMLKTQKTQQETLEQIANEKSNSTSLTDELEKLADLKERGVLTDIEFNVAKRKIIMSEKEEVKQQQKQEDFDDMDMFR